MKIQGTIPGSVGAAKPAAASGPVRRRRRLIGCLRVTLIGPLSEV
jgi:hypothetical protein